MAKALAQAKRTLSDKGDSFMISYFLEKSEVFHFQICSPLGLSHFKAMIRFLDNSPVGGRSYFSYDKLQHNQPKFHTWHWDSKRAHRQLNQTSLTILSPWVLRVMPHRVSAQLSFSISISDSLKEGNRLTVPEKCCSTPEPKEMRGSEMLGDFK